MSEVLPNNNPEDSKNDASQWEGLQDPSAQAESQEVGTTADEATLQKIGKNVGVVAEASKVAAEEEQEEPDDQEAQDIPAQETTSLAEQSKSHPYERTIQGPDGMIHHLEAETQEELEDKVADLREYYREMYG